MLEAKKLQLETMGVIVRDSEFNRGLRFFVGHAASAVVGSVEAPDGMKENYGRWRAGPRPAIKKSGAC